ncbi:O-antigen polysaccharide polymerase Wzy [Propionibacteriaceae bacterium Y1700]|uniref:O-antigen polysaccharide polymerase Wzy n=1 Tax=Microlunatus sp. Y1700 TaxID=3418487 RepID=UPI003DA729D4
MSTPAPQPSRSRGIHANQLLLLAAAIINLALLLVFSDGFASLSLRMVATIMLVGEVVLGALIARVDQRGVWSFPFLFYLILAIFHSGLYLAPALLNHAPLSLTQSDGLWYVSPQIERAGYLVAIGMACYALGFALSGMLPQGRKDRRSDEGGASESAKTRDGIVDVGCAMVVACVGAWFAIGAISGGPFFFIGSYLSFLQTTGGSALPWIYLGMAMGLTMCALDLNRGTGRVGIIAFALFSMPAFVLGLRGEVMFPAVAAMAVAGATRKILSTRTFVLACLIALLGISFVAQVRIAGISSVGSTEVVVSPIRAVEEMGYSVRPLTASIEWHEAGREPYLRGGTYIGPIDRQVNGLLGRPVPDATRDPRMMNVEIAERVGNIGGSIMAEAHHNWGGRGVGLVLLLVGGVSGRMFRPGMGPVGLALSGVLAVLLLMHVRNSFAPLPAWAAVGAFLVISGVLLGKLHTRTSQAQSTSRTPNRKRVTL